MSSLCEYVEQVQRTLALKGVIMPHTETKPHSGKHLDLERQD
jgi:hypothetical protein